MTQIMHLLPLETSQGTVQCIFPLLISIDLIQETTNDQAIAYVRQSVSLVKKHVLLMSHYR